MGTVSTVIDKVNTSSSELSQKSFGRVATLQTTIVVLVLSALGLILRDELRVRFIDSQQRQVQDLLELLTREFPADFKPTWCRQIASTHRFRLTVVHSETGKILCDNHYDIPDSPSILERTEIQAALKSLNEPGFSYRPSSFLKDINRMYAARYFPDKKLIMRVGYTVQSLEEGLADFDRLLVVTIVGLALLLILVLQFTTRGFLFRQTSKMLGLVQEQMQKNLVANVTHEFRTPLTSIQGFAQALKSDLKKGEPIQAEHLSIIEHDCQRLLMLVDDLLDQSAIDSGMLSIAKEWVSVRQATEDALQRLRVVYEDRSPKIFTHFECEEVFADPNRLHQILINVIGNSLKHCPPGTRLDIRWKQENSWTLLEVQDEGPGVPDPFRAKLFGRFQKHRGTDSQTKGAGLGLSIVMGLVQAHGGKVELMDLRQGFGLRIGFLTSS